MTDERIERVAEALAKGGVEQARSKSAIFVSDRHRHLARIAIRTLEGMRAASSPQLPASAKEHARGKQVSKRSDA